MTNDSYQIDDKPAGGGFVKARPFRRSTAAMDAACASRRATAKADVTNSPGYRCGWVAIMGPPNAGKSTLLNAALGQKVAIVTPKAQTTRNRITGILTDKDAQVIFMDTPGIHQQRGKMNRVLAQTAWDAVESADVIMVVLDADMYARKPEFLDSDLKSVAGAVAAEKRPVFVVANKVDLLGDKSRLLPLLETLHGIWPQAEIFPCSALHEDGLPRLVQALKKALPEADAQFPEDQVSTLTVRFMATEIIREKLFLSLRQELPYAAAVDIEAWKEEPERDITFINAAIYVARPSQKAIVIGKGGRNLKQIGQSARQEIAGLLETRVHLELWVKVREAWPEDLGFLHDLGLGERL